MSLEDLRQTAEFCLRFAGQTESRETAARLKALATASLGMVDMEGEHLIDEQPIDGEDMTAAETRF